MMDVGPDALERPRGAAFAGIDLLGVVMPTAIGLVFLGAWEAAVRLAEVPIYILPGPWLILGTLVGEWDSLFGSLLITLQVTVAAFLAPAIGGGAPAILFPRS